MVYAAIIAVGLLAGLGEFFLLRRFVAALLAGDAMKGAVLLPLKLLLLAVGLLPALLLEPALLWLSGCALALPLVLGGAIAGIRGFSKGGEG